MTLIERWEALEATLELPGGYNVAESHIADALYGFRAALAAADADARVAAAARGLRNSWDDGAWSMKDVPASMVIPLTCLMVLLPRATATTPPDAGDGSVKP